MSDLDGTPEGSLLRDIGFHKFNVGLATGEVRLAEDYLAEQNEALNRSIGDASVQLILMRDAPNVSEREKLAFATQLLRLQGAESLDTEAVMAQFDSFAPGVPIIFVGEHCVLPRIIMSESRIGIRPNYKKSGFRVTIDCRAQGVNHHRDEEYPEEFTEFNSSIDTSHLAEVVVGIPSFQKYIDSFPGSIPDEKLARRAYGKRLGHIFSSIENMKKLGVEGADELTTTRLRTLQSLVGNTYDDGQYVRPRSDYGWWPRH